MRKVVDSRQVGHLWANAAQPTAYNSGRSVSFDGPTFYSYETPIAYRGEFNDKTFYFVTSEKFSMTTSSKHMNVVWRSIGYGSGRTVFTVPLIPRNSLGKQEAIDANFEWQKFELLKSVKVAQIANVANRPTKWLNAHNRASGLQVYCQFFELTYPTDLPTPSELSDLAISAETKLREHNLKNSTPEAIAKRERINELREAAKQRKLEKDRADMLARNAQKIEDWKNGLHVYALLYDLPTILRIKGDLVETSKGASFPLEHGLKALPLIRKCVDNGGCDFTQTDHRPKLGHYTIDKITATELRAGCHLIQISEIERLAATIEAKV